ncbi:MAG: hypothetical protein V1897_09055 [Pseudomonadota bacterium]
MAVIYDKQDKKYQHTNLDKDVSPEKRHLGRHGLLLSINADVTSDVTLRHDGGPELRFDGGESLKVKGLLHAGVRKVTCSMHWD